MQEVHIATNLSGLAVRNLFQNQLCLQLSVLASKANSTVCCTTKVKGLKIVNRCNGAPMSWFFSCLVFTLVLSFLHPLLKSCLNLEEVQNPIYLCFSLHLQCPFLSLYFK